jgi:hypothetical protein
MQISYILFFVTKWTMEGATYDEGFSTVDLDDEPDLDVIGASQLSGMPIPQT